MQLNLIVEFHKALADPTRIRILAMLADGPLHGQAIAGKLGVTAPTVTHHLAKLREVGLVFERRDKNTIYFSLDQKTLEFKSQGILQIVLKSKEKEAVDMDVIVDKREKERAAVIKNFFTVDGKLKTIPSQRKKKLYAFEHMIKGLKVGKKYTEKELNEYIKHYHDDYATIRREFIINQYMYREDSVYELNPSEMWAT